MAPEAEFDYSWQGIIRPGLAENFFCLHNPPSLDPDTTVFSDSTAWWLAEICRLSYRNGPRLKKRHKGYKRRSEILEDVNMKIALSLNVGGLQSTAIEYTTSSKIKLGILVFRGSANLRNWLANLNTFPTQWDKGGYVHSGFKKAIETLWKPLESFLSQIDYPLLYTGHSLGGALAILAAAKSISPPLSVYTFGAPKVGDKQFADLISDLKIFRVVNHKDLVPRLPPPPPFFSFQHHGEHQYFTSTGEKWVNPNTGAIRIDRKKSDRKSIQSHQTYAWYDPPEALYDHAPINYISHLQNQIAKSKRS